MLGGAAEAGNNSRRDRRCRGARVDGCPTLATALARLIRGESSIPSMIEMLAEHPD